MEPLTQITARPRDVAPRSDDPLALSLNENPFAPLPAVRTAIVEASAAANRYPEFLPERLRCLIATHIGVGDEQVIVAAGATGVVMQVLHTVTSPGDRIVLATPTFDGYPIFAQMARLTLVAVPLDQQGRQDLTTMAEAAADARVIVLCRPHNPTGTVEPTLQVQRFLNQVPSDVVVVIDEAYIEFVHPKYRLDCRTLVRRHPNVIVVRTFSKAYGLAGIRTGYGICSPSSAQALWAMQLPFGSTFTSLAAVAASYRAEDQLQERIRFITAERAYLRTRLRELGVSSTDSHANFVYLPPAGKPWRDAFERTGLQVRSYRDGGVRITVGGRPSTTAVLAAIGKSVAASA
ncbi:aminotransferase class I/II-fold pyridoxal phosphate-dependent enzyme [Mycolicibacterium septicum]|uniref:pyridoxal phosphate-dependent aminotransferase n=1 Tax=Mycolicibacterium septicum TaxID=98668 RepID=UPI0023E2D77A|nr:aminotransferase class I/II-fold pyridoxal phosphate-dependent enzyme [Mycolicibacterium septicum]MDF3342116.1 aminotransferase class I/II-fold pyridoxal phosphate-dependent enzyme [Mycolicibacterium septicum]